MRFHFWHQWHFQLAGDVFFPIGLTRQSTVSLAREVTNLPQLKIHILPRETYRIAQPQAGVIRQKDCRFPLRRCLRNQRAELLVCKHVARFFLDSERLTASAALVAINPSRRASLNKLRSVFSARFAVVCAFPCFTWASRKPLRAPDSQHQCSPRRAACRRARRTRQRLRYNG